MSDRAAIRIRSAGPDDSGWIVQTLRERWGSETVVSRGRAHGAVRLPALLALVDNEPAGLAS